ncbi:MAG: alpha-glucosidase, partial [Pseudomonadales bacterium]|nr:alpha-glucosidase [Pseudomonadales bacterium]
MFKPLRWLGAGSLMLLVACGGGGSGSDSGSSDSSNDGNDTSNGLQMQGFNAEWDEQQLTLKHGNNIVWQSKSGLAVVVGGVHHLEAEENRGSFIVEENIQSLCESQIIDNVRVVDNELLVTGSVSGAVECESDFTLTFQQVLPGHLQFHLQFDNPRINYSQLNYASTTDERFYGFGEQYTHLNLKGKAVPVLSEEGGVGRGRDLISAPVSLVSPGSGGNELTTYYAVPQYITNTNRSLFLENTDYVIFDLTADDQVSLRLFSGVMTGRVLAGESMLDLIERFTEYTGRMRPLPDWFNQGAIVGIQGGTEFVNGILDELESRGTPVAGVWLQDWVGKRVTAAGSQLWWNWELDEDRYPGWDSLVDRIEDDFGGRMMCYINAFLVDATPKGNVQRNLYQEAIDDGYLVMHPDGGVYEVTNTDFAAGMIDLTNPSAQTWIKSVIKDNLIDTGRCSGWMHDFAEALPFDAVLHSGEDAATYHNQYTVDWARMGREAITEAGREDDIVFFNRAGATRTPAYSTLVWQGDQMVTWDEHDGFQSAINATLSGGFSGISLNHSDIGGYTNASLGIPGLPVRLGFDREEDLLLRWMEFSAFTAAYRTHEGLAPETNAQFYDNDATYDHFDKFARVYKALAFYRETLMQEAQDKGYPVVRHPMLHYPEDEKLASLQDHIMLGSEILVAPVVDKRLPTESRGDPWKKVYFPDADNTVWVHVFTGEKFGAGQDYTP